MVSSSKQYLAFNNASNCNNLLCASIYLACDVRAIQLEILYLARVPPNRSIYRLRCFCCFSVLKSLFDN